MNNKILETIHHRISLRVYDDRPITDEELNMILHAAMRAPTAGNQMLYSIIVIRDQETKDKLSVSCDHQPFIAKAPVLLLFVADYHKWFDYFRKNDVPAFCERNKDLGFVFEEPQESDLLLACEDAMIAAQNAVLAAESLDIGSCYIGDIVEHFEYHQDLFDLPKHVFPISLVCLGHYKSDYPRVIHRRFNPKFVVFNEKYHQLSDDEYKEMFEEVEKGYRADNQYGAENYAQMFYARKTGAAFCKEMARSVKVALKDWQGK